MKQLLSSILLAIALPISILAQSPATGISLLKKTVIGGTGKWDYISVSPGDRRLYISHSTQVEVLDADTHAKIGVIHNTSGVHGICPILSLGKGFITNGKTNNVTVFDIKTLKPIQLVPAGENPDALLYDSFSNRVFIFNNDSKNITVIDAISNKVVKTIDVGGNPEAGVTNGKGMIYVNLEDINEIVAFDSRTLAIKNRFKLSPGEQPTGLAFDRQTHRLFSTCRKSQLMIVLNSDNGKVLARLPIGKMVDGAIFDDQAKLAVCSNGEGSMTVVKEISPDQFAVTDTIATRQGAKTLAFDPTTEHLYTITALFSNQPATVDKTGKERPSIVPGTFMLLEYGKKKSGRL